MKQTTSLKYIKGFDSLRCLAIIGVVLFHFFPGIVKGGYLGVCMFLMLSGYLMFLTTSQGMEQGQGWILSFYKKRFIRLYVPLYIMVVSVLAFFTLFCLDALKGIRQELPSIFLGYNNWWQIAVDSNYFTKMISNTPFRHLWYLGIEIQIIVVWPLIMLAYRSICQKAKDVAGAILFLILFALSVAAMIWLESAQHASVTRIYYGTDTRAFAIFAGAFLAAMKDRIRSCFKWLSSKITCRIIYVICLAAVLAMYIYIDGESAFLYQGGLVLCCIPFALLMILCDGSAVCDERFMHLPGIMEIGKYSYTIYLWHYPLYYMIKIWGWYL